MRMAFLHAFQFGKILFSDSSTGNPTVQVKHNDFSSPADVPVFQQFGLASQAPVGSWALTVKVNGSDPAVIATHNSDSRPAVPSGGIVLYDSSGASINLPNTGQITIIIGGTQVGYFDSAGLHITGDVIASGISLKNHIHQDGASSYTGPPIG